MSTTLAVRSSGVGTTATPWIERAVVEHAAFAACQLDVAGGGEDVDAVGVRNVSAPSSLRRHNHPRSGSTTHRSHRRRSRHPRRRRQDRCRCCRDLRRAHRSQRKRRCCRCCSIRRRQSRHRFPSASGQPPNCPVAALGGRTSAGTPGFGAAGAVPATTASAAASDGVPGGDVGRASRSVVHPRCLTATAVAAPVSAGGIAATQDGVGGVASAGSAGDAACAHHNVKRLAGSGFDCLRSRSRRLRRLRRRYRFHRRPTRAPEGRVRPGRGRWSCWLGSGRWSNQA